MFMELCHKQSDSFITISYANIGDNAAFYFVQATTVMILVLAANTGFTAFPMLAASMSKDKYMPRMFTVRGDRLGYSNSIIILGVLAIILIIVFDGMTEDLIPLYAVGVFIPFTLAQFGMVIKWIHERPKNWLSKLSVNLLGGIVTFIVFMILLITKFSQVWPILIFLPFVVIFFLKINKHYRDIAEQLRSDIDVHNVEVVDRNLAIVPITSITTAVDKSICTHKCLRIMMSLQYMYHLEMKMKKHSKRNGNVISQM